MTDPEETTVLTELHDFGVLVMTLNRPARLNAWTPDMNTRFMKVLDDAAADPEVRVVVITGAGRGFCAGADMAALGDAAAGERPETDDYFRRTVVDAAFVPKPVIAAINGPCAGLGLALALACDLRFAAAGAKLTTSYARRGLVAEYGTSWMLPRLVGTARALDLLMSGRTVLADEAADLGLINGVLAPDSLLDHVMTYATDLATNCSPRSLAAIKSQVRSDATKSLQDSISASLRLMSDAYRSSDFREGVRAYSEKRRPQFDALPDSR